MSSFARCVARACLFASLAACAPSPTEVLKPSLTKRDDANPTICGDIIDAVNQGSNVFFASDAYDCLLTVPFNDAVALQFIDYYNTTIQFQSTLAYLRNPPAEYRQPAVDVLQGLEQIKANVTNGVYKSQYVFEADLQHLVYRMHDAHVDLSAGILSVFTFASPFNLVSASTDGTALPKLYIAGNDQMPTRFFSSSADEPVQMTSRQGSKGRDSMCQLFSLSTAGTRSRSWRSSQP